MKKHYASRTPVEDYQRCHRKRWWGNYAAQGEQNPQGGIEPVAISLPLLVGSAFHAGRATMLTLAQQALDENGNDLNKVPWDTIETYAVQDALAEFSTRSQAIDREDNAAGEVPTGDSANGGATSGNNGFGAVSYLTPQSAPKKDSGFDWASLGLSPDSPEVKALMGQQQVAVKAEGDAKAQYEAWFQGEQRALVEAMTRAYVRRRLRPLLEQYEVLEVEREGEWLLSRWEGFTQGADTPDGFPDGKLEDRELWFQSRPDALLRDRLTGDLVVDSLKTAAAWDKRKEKDAQHDMQGLSEGVEIEQRLADWWDRIHNHKAGVWPAGSQKVLEFLRQCSAPPRILAIRYDYVLKGQRTGPDYNTMARRLSERFGFTIYAQNSPLVAAYLNEGMAAGDEQWCVASDHRKEDGTTGKLYYKNWKKTAVWEHMPVRQWIDRLDASAPTVTADADALGQDVRELGWKSEAQAVGYLDQHPLDACFVPPMIVYRNDDELRDWLEQVEAQEVAVAQHVEEVRVAEAAGDQGEVRSLLNRHFPQNRRACQWPGPCPFGKEGKSLCFGGAELAADPLGSGFFKPRDPNHPEGE